MLDHPRRLRQRPRDGRSGEEGTIGYRGLGWKRVVRWVRYVTFKRFRVAQKSKHDWDVKKYLSNLGKVERRFCGNV